MKQKLLLLLLLLLTGWGGGSVMAQLTSEINVGDWDNATTTYNGSYFDMAPTNFYLAHTGVQMLYTPDLLGKMNCTTDVKINSLQFKFHSETYEEITRNVKLYLQEVDATEFAKNDGGVKQFFTFGDPVVDSEYKIDLLDSYDEDATLDFQITDGFAFTPGKTLLVTIVFDAEDDENCTSHSDYAPFYSSGIGGKAMTYTNNSTSFVDYAQGGDFPDATASQGCGTNVELPLTKIGYSYTPPTVITEQPEGTLTTYRRSGGCVSNYWGIASSAQNGKMDVVINGEEAYIKNPSWYCDYDTWVEGTYDAETGIITIPTGQFLSWYDNNGYGIQMMWGSTSMIEGTDDEGETTYDLDSKVDENVTEIRFLIENETITLLDSSGDLNAEYPQNCEAEGIYLRWSDDLLFRALEFNTQGKVAHIEPAVPANPTADDWYDCGDETGFSKFYFTLPTKDVEGNLLDPECFSFSIYTDDDQLFTFPAEDYTYDLYDDITEVPYSLYSSAVDFHDYYVYMYRTNEGDNPLFENRIGIQVHYTVDGVKYSSDIVYYYLPTDLANHPANPTADEWYDCGDESGFSKFYFTLPTTDVDGNDLDPEYLSYSIYTDDDQLFTFPAEDYTFDDLYYDITEVPYDLYSNAVDFHDYYVYMYRTNEEGYEPLFKKNIGIQVHYNGYSSDIVYLYPTLFDKRNNYKTLAEYDGKKIYATIEGRTIYTDGRWNTLCLPFNLSAEQIEESPLAGFEVKELDTEDNDSYDHITGYEAESKTLYLNFKEAESIVAGKPYIVRMPEPEGTVHRAAGITDPTFKNVTIKSSSPTIIKSEDGTVTFQGVYSPLTFVEGAMNRSMLFLQNNSLYYPDGTAPTTVNAFRAYFPLKGIHGGTPEEDSHPVRSFVLNFGDGDATAVEMVNGEIVDGKSDAWYDLSGRKLNQKPAQRGIYINNGRKVLVNDNK